MSTSDTMVLEPTKSTSSNDAKVLQLVQEIRDLYVHTCELADRQGEFFEADDRELIEKCKARTYVAVPELNYYKDVFEQGEAIQRAYKDPVFKRVMGNIQSMATLLVASLCIWVFLRTSSVLATAVIVVGSAVLTYVIANRMWYRGMLQKYLRRELASQGVPICVACGYDLRGQQEPRCPECGTACDAKFLQA